MMSIEADNKGLTVIRVLAGIPIAARRGAVESFIVCTGLGLAGREKM